MHYVPNKGYCEASGLKVCSKREMALKLARIAGYNNDSGTFTRLIIENRANRQAMNEAFRNGMAARKAQP